MTLTVITNNKPRELLCLYDLPRKERKDFDYIKPDSDEAYDARFFKYKGSYYDTQDCEPIFRDTMAAFRSWNGIFTETYFSGVLWKYATFNAWDNDKVIVGRYCT